LFEFSRRVPIQSHLRVLCPSKLSSSIRFINDKDESKEEADEDLMMRITDAIQALAPASTATANMELEEQVISYTRQMKRL
jgi:hypothetical protein